MSKRFWRDCQRVTNARESRIAVGVYAAGAEFCGPRERDIGGSCAAWEPPTTWDTAAPDVASGDLVTDSGW
jgi:hypothetical protein